MTRWSASLGLAVGVALVCLATARAADEKADPNGTWHWTITAQNGQSFESKVKLKKEGDKLTGTYIGRDNQETPIENGKCKDGEVSFQVTRERNGQKFLAKYSGKVSGDEIKGKISAEFGGQERSFDWNAKRVK